ncbi:MAG TPA: preprotein translocase subunit SecE [Rubrobacteraceae bacterium]|jgi:preprotein translocase subunit SecE|nr:preprotein translocase subunit SecE [Rubrobacteraceae bacterium]
MGNKRSSTAAKGGGKGKTQENKSTGRLSGTIEFVRGVRGELRRVSWPNRDQLQQSTAVVLIILVLLTAYVFLWDTIFYYLARLVFT